MKHTKQLFMILLVAFLLIGLGTLAASEVTKNDTSVTKSTNIAKTSTISKDATSTSKISTTQKSNDNNKIVNTKPNTKTDKIQNNKTITKTNSTKKVKTTPIIVNITDYNQLNSTLTSSTFEEVTINIQEDITLNGSTIVNDTIKSLTINGNQKTINGSGLYQFLKLSGNSTLFLYNLTIIRCTAKNGGAIYGDINSTISIHNTNLINNTANETGGAIWNNGKLNITLSSLNNNTANETGGAIWNNGKLNITLSSLNNNTAINGGAIRNDGNLTIHNSSLNNNSVTWGGAIDNNYGNITITNSTLNNNLAWGGGAINNDLGNITLIGNTINNNTGSAIRNHGTISIDNTILNNNNASAGSGAAIVNNANITITNSTLINNTATFGGAILNYVNMTITDSTLNNNTAGQFGGAINNGGNLNINNTTIEHNTAGSGGAIYNNANMTITDTTLNNNTANGAGGAIYGNINNTITINNSILTNNKALSESGGAIYVLTNSTITINYSILTNNRANNAGGAIRNIYGTLNITDSNITNNQAVGIRATGGAIHSSGNITIYNSNLTSNTAASSYGVGGAITNSGNLTIYNSNITSNTASGPYGSGGAIHSSGNLNIYNSNLTGNTAIGPYGSGGAITNSKNLNIYNSNLTGNTATVYGTGGAISNSGNLTINNSNLTRNTAIGPYGTGGAISNSGNLTLNNSNLTRNTVSDMGGIGGAIHNTGILNIASSNITYNNAVYAGAIKSNRNMTMYNNNFINNYVTGTGYVIDFSDAIYTNITDNYFENNTNNNRDMLFTNARNTSIVEIHNNTYIDNFLADSIIPPVIGVVSNTGDRVYEYDVDLELRSIYNDTIRNGTMKIYVNGVLKNSSNVTDGKTSISFNNHDLTKRENNITLEYISLSKHYQRTSTKFTVLKEINTTLTIQAPSSMINGDTAQINFTLVDVDGNPLIGKSIIVSVDEVPVATVTTNDSGVANYTFTANHEKLAQIGASYQTPNDSIYLSAEDVKSIEITKIEPKIVIIADNNIIAHHETEIQFNMTEPDGTPITNKLLEIRIKEEGKPDITETVTTNSTGIATFRFTPDDEGTFWVNATYPGNIRYQPVSAEVELSKGLVVTNLEITATPTKINTTNIITLTVIPTNNAKINGTVELNISGEIHTVTITNGTGSYTQYRPTTAGQKTVSGKFTSTTQGYGHSTDATNFNVEKLPTTTTITVLNNKAGNLTLKINIDPEDPIPSTVNDGTIEIKSINGTFEKTIYNGTLTDGTLTFKTDIEEIGQYNFKAIYHGNEYFYGSDNSTSVEVKHVNTKTTTYDKTAKVGDKITLNATLQDETGTNLEGETIQFYLNNQPITHPNGDNVTAQIINGIATTEYTLPNTLTNGTYQILAKYHGNNKYATSNHTAELTINALKTEIKGETLNNTLSNVTIKVILTDSNNNNNPIPDAPIIITLPNEEKIPTITRQDGTVIVPLDLPSGQNTIKLDYPGNGTYQPSNNTLTINVEKILTTTTVEVLDTTIGNVTIKVRVTNNTQDPVTTGNITIQDENNIIIEGLGNINLTNGEATIQIPATTTGTIKIKVQYNENEIYKASNAQNKTTGEPIITIPVTKIPTNLKTTTNNGTEPTVDIILTDKNGKPIGGAPITIKDKNGNKIGNGTTKPDGSITIPINIPIGRQDIIAEYPGNQTYNAASNTTSTRRDKHTPKIDVIVDSNGTVKINITDETGNPIPGLPVNITDETGKIIGNGTTDKNGTITIPTRLEPGNHNITATTPETQDNKGGNITVPVVIPPKDTKMNITVTDPIKGNTTIKVDLKDNEGKPITGAPITVTLPDGTRIPATTKPDGTVEVPVNLPVGNNNVKVDYPGNTTYKPISQTIPVNVQKTPTTTTITVPSSTAGNVRVTGTVKDKYNKNVNEGTITIKNGNTIIGTGRLTNGAYNILTNINKGSYTLTAEYSGTNNYLPSSAKTPTPIPVPGIPTSITTQITGNKVGNTTITATLKDTTGKPITNAPITVTLPNGTQIRGTTNNNGTAQIPIDLREGLNNITTTYNGNGTYNPINRKDTINVSKNIPVITLNPVKGIIGEKITLTAYLKDADGTPITGGNLAFKLNGKTLRSDGRFDSNAAAMKFTVKDGKVTYTINADLYLRNAKNLTAAYSGNYKYTETPSPTVEAQIQKRYAGVTLTVTPTLNKQYDTIKFTATVRDTTKNGKNTTLINQNTKVMFKVNGNTLKDNKGQIIYVPVNNNKQAIYNYIIPAGTGGITASKKVRDYKVDAIFIGDNYYPGARNNTKFNVERSATYVNITQARVTSSNVLSVKATLKDFKGNNLIGTNKVTIKVNGKSYIDPKNGKPKYWSVKNGIVNLSGITVDPKTTIKRVMLVTGERQAYTEGRAETTNIIRT